MGKKRNKKPLIQALRIEGTAAEGKSFGRWNDKIVFTKYTAPGDVVDVQLTKNRSSHAEGNVVAFIEKSDLRIDPFCEHFGTCGGCKWQHLPYDYQLEQKNQQVKDNLSRIGGIELPEFEPILGAPKTKYYRNKMEFTFSNKRWLTNEQIKSEEEFERRGLGFHIPGAFDKVLDLHNCYLQSTISDDIRKEIKRYALEHDLSFFDIRDQVGLLRNLMIRSGAEGELMVLVSFFEDTEAVQPLMEHVKNSFPQISSLMYIINPKKNDTMEGLEPECYSGKDHIVEKMEDLTFKVNPKSFFQTNSEQALNLYSVVRDFAGLTGNEVVYDLYSGTGTIGLFLAKQCKQVVGVEYVDDAVKMAEENMQINHVEHAKYFAGDMKDLLNKDFIVEHGKPDVVITDPPRAGMHEDVVNVMLEMAAEKIVYVSCNPATQARDLKLLDVKYKVERVRPVDMFPQTHHIENVVLLTLKK
jgi:23S rRNA (uracil1939-C5)-methyltransferase